MPITDQPGTGDFVLQCQKPSDGQRRCSAASEAAKGQRQRAAGLPGSPPQCLERRRHPAGAAPCPPPGGFQNCPLATAQHFSTLPPSPKEGAGMDAPPIQGLLNSTFRSLAGFQGGHRWRSQPVPVPLLRCFKQVGQRRRDLPFGLGYLGHSEEAMAAHSSALAWRIPWMEEPGGLQSMGSRRVGHAWATSLSLLCIGEGNGSPLQCSCLETPRDGGAWWAAVYGVAQSQTRLRRLSSSSSSIRAAPEAPHCPVYGEKSGLPVWGGPDLHPLLSQPAS